MKRNTLAFLAIFVSLIIVFFSAVSAKACETITPEPSPTISVSVTDVSSVTETPSDISSATETPSVTVEPSVTPTELPTATVEASTSVPSETPTDVTISPMPGESLTPIPVPEPEIKYSLWMWPAACGEIVVEQEHHKFTTPYKIIDGVAVLDTDNTSDVIEYRHHKLTVVEAEPFQSVNPEGYCYVAPTQTPSATVSTSATQTPSATPSVMQSANDVVSITNDVPKLGHTGPSALTSWLFIIGVGAIGVGVMLLLFGSHKPKKH